MVGAGFDGYCEHETLRHERIDVCLLLVSTAQQDKPERVLDLAMVSRQGTRDLISETAQNAKPEGP